MLCLYSYLPTRAPQSRVVVFQVLGKLYAVLSDEEQRAVYDDQGLVDEDSDVLRQDRCWEDYWRLLFPKVPARSRAFLKH